MGVVQRFERRLEGLVEGAFTKIFRGGVEPVEIAKGLQREAGDHRTIAPSRVLVPNDYYVALGTRDYERLSPYAVPLGAELAAMVREHAVDHNWSFVGPVTVSFEQLPEVDTGTFRIRSGVVAGDIESPLPAASTGRPRLIITDRPGAAPREVVIEQESSVVGRGSDARIRIDDAGVSRRHAEVRREGDEVFLVDLGSTNGTLVNGRAVERTRLTPGDRISIGRTVLIYERDDG
ncbi:MAG: DUF3662 and FHA domain-containing protein [Mycobacteriales bacterium]